MNSDIIVVGAGPAGLFSAFQAAKLGAQTIICEAHSEVGVPVHCTGHVGLAGLKRLGLRLPKNVFENEIKSATFHSPFGRRFSVRFDSAVTCVVDRTVFDQHLLGLALKAGAEIQVDTTVVSFLLEKRAVSGVVARRKKKNEKLTSNVVVDAEGVSSNLLKRAGLPSVNRHMVIHGVQALVEGVDDVENDTVEVFLSRRFTPGFFAWIVPRGDGTAKVGLGTEKGNPRDCFCHFIRHNQFARRKLKRSHVVGTPVYHPISLGGPISKTFHDGLLVVGDAASHVKPTTGGGVIMGLTCAKIAGVVAANAVRNRNFSGDFLSLYEQRWKKKVGFDLMVMKRLRLMLNNLSDKRLDRLLSFCSRLKVDESLKMARDVDFQGNSLIRISRSPKFLAAALYFLIASFL